MRFSRAAACAVVMVSGLAVGQQEPPDAPSAVQQQSGQLPDAPQPQQQPTFPKTIPVQSEPQAPGSQPSSAMPGVPHAPNSGVDSRDDMFKIIVQVNQVFIPVTVRDGSGHLMEGLLRKDFTVLEDGKPQNINFFTSDPFPLSAAVVLDTNLPDTELKKVNETMGALVGAFSDYDEVAFYTYGSSVRRELDYGAMTDRYATAMRRVKPKGQNPGPPVTSGPMQGGPSINGRPVDPGAPMVIYPGRESEVLNDAILAAARELRKRDRARRKIIFVISDGKEWGSHAGFDEVRKVLLSSEITVYGVAVDTGAIPGYRNLQKVHIPGTSAYGDILNRYARDTGGEVFPELERQAIEAAYARVTSTARNQYTIGYKTKASASGTYRTIEVQVHRGGLDVKAKPGYFPLPPGS